jgi:hypothetical protein
MSPDVAIDKRPSGWEWEKMNGSITSLQDLWFVIFDHLRIGYCQARQQVLSFDA